MVRLLNLVVFINLNHVALVYGIHINLSLGAPGVSIPGGSKGSAIHGVGKCGA